jgi:hypothetical protein
LVCDELVRYKANFKYSSAIFEGELMRTRSKHEDSFDIDNYIARLRVRTVVGAVWFTQVELGAAASALKRPLYCAAYIDGRWTWQVYHGFQKNAQFRYNHETNVTEDCSSFGLHCAQLPANFVPAEGDLAIINEGNFHFTAAIVVSLDDAGAQTVTCPICDLGIYRDSSSQHSDAVLSQHFDEAHAVPDTQAMGTVPCQVCSMYIHPDVMAQHFDEVHAVPDNPHSVVKKQRGADTSGVGTAWQPDVFATSLLQLEKYGKLGGAEDRATYIALIRTTSEDKMYYALASLTRVVVKSPNLHVFLLGELWSWFVTVATRICSTDTLSKERSVTVRNQPQMREVGALMLRIRIAFVRRARIWLNVTDSDTLETYILLMLSLLPF